MNPIKDPKFSMPVIKPGRPGVTKPVGPGGKFQTGGPQTGGPMPRPNFPVGGQTKPVGPGGKPANPMLDAMKRRLSGA